MNPQLFYFVINNENDPSDIMKSAYILIKQKKYNPRWVNLERLKASKLKNEDIVVMERFDGESFDYLENNNIQCRIIGPHVIKYCDNNVCKSPFSDIPKRPFPISSQCMRSLEVTTSNLGDKKNQIHDKILAMAGSCSAVLRATTSCLVTDSVITRKYHGAVKHNIPIVSVNWVEECYEKYQYEFHRANEQFILSKHRLPPLNNLEVVVSGLSSDERTQLQKIITKYGGKYSPGLRLKPVSPNQILLLREQTGDKYKYARKNNIPCLRLDWIHDSIKKGYALPFENYDIDGKLNDSPSPPTIEPEVIYPQPNAGTPVKILEKLNPEKNYATAKIIDELTMEIKDKFLDDYIVHATGFDLGTLDSIKASLRHCGAFHYDELKPAVHFVICGPEVTIRKFYQIIDDGFGDRLVTIDWLIRCLTTKKVCAQVNYLVKSIEQLTASSCKKDSNKPLISNKVYHVSPLKYNHKEQQLKTTLNDQDEANKSVEDVANKDTAKTTPAVSEQEFMNNYDDDEVNPPVVWSEKDPDDFFKDDEDYSTDGNVQATELKRLSSPDNENCNKKVRQSSSPTNNNSNASENDNQFMDDTDEICEQLILDDESKDSTKENITEPLFMFSGFDPESKAQYINDLKSVLKINTHDDAIVSPKVTHFILKEPVATEKVLSVIAAGISLLKPAYLFDSLNAGKLLDNDDDYQWGLDYINETNQTKSIRSHLMKSSIKWKTYLLQNKKKLFQDLKFLILNNCSSSTANEQPQQQSMMEAFVNILKAGSAKVYLLDDYHQKEEDLKILISKHIDFALIEPSFKRKPLMRKDKFLTYIAFFEHSQQLFNFQLIWRYIINGPDQTLGSFAKKFTLKMSDVQQSINHIYKDN